MAAVDRDRFVQFHDTNVAATPTSAAAGPRPETVPADVNLFNPGFAESGAAAADAGGVRDQLDLVAFTRITAPSLIILGLAPPRFE